jgi:hypothetical protein
LYPILIRLAERGLVEAQWEKRAAARPPASTSLPAHRDRRATAGAIAIAMSERSRLPTTVPEVDRHRGAPVTVTARWRGFTATIIVVPVERRGLVEAVLSETVDVPDGRDRLSWQLGACLLMIREALVKRRLARTVSFAGHVATGVAAVWAVVVVTDGVSYAPLRRAMIALAVVIAAVLLLGWVPRVLGPVADDAAARAVRAVGLVLAALAVWGVLVEFWFNGDPSQVNPGVAERANTGIPLLTILLAIYLAAFLAVTRRGSVLRGATLMYSLALTLAAVIVWAGAAILIPPASAPIGLAVMAAAGVGAAKLTIRRGVVTSVAALAGLLSAMMTAQVVISVADVLFHLGPDAWIPDAGPGPLTLQARLAQNRVEAIDPYVSVLFVGAVVAITLIVVTLAPRIMRPAELAEATSSA